MHSRLADAAESVPSLRAGLVGHQFNHSHSLPNFGSTLMLRWAGHMEAIDLHENLYGCFGLADFLAAAKHATTVQMHSRSLLAAAQADRLLHACKSVTSLELSGIFMPSNLASTITDLHAIFAYHTPDLNALNSVQCDALLYRADILPQLKHLSLTFTGTIPAVLTCPIQLAQLQVLNLALDVSCNELDLSWVQLQACPRLNCMICLDVSKKARHEAAVAQLSPLMIRSLALSLEVPFTSSRQQLWGQLRACSLHLKVFENSFSQASGALQILPRSCTNIVIETVEFESHQMMYISWAALVSRAANIRVITNHFVTVQILGHRHACMATSEMQQPWQFVVQGAKTVHGLPASLASDKTYFQQNAAAGRAGWTDETA